MARTQDLIATTMTDPTQDLIDELVPPRRSRWVTGLFVVLFVAALAAIPVVKYTGAAVPRLTVWADQATFKPGDISVTWHVRNNGHVDATLRGFDGRAPGLEGAKVQTKLPVSLAPKASTTVIVTYTKRTCRTGAAPSPFMFVMHTDASGPPGWTFTSAHEINRDLFEAGCPEGN